MDKRGAQLFVVLLICLACLPGLSSAHVKNLLFEGNELHSSTSSPSFFVFGASMVDAGTNAVAMPLRSSAEFFPYGSDYFDKPVGRWSNGRTFMDILNSREKSKKRKQFSNSIYFLETAHNDYLKAGLDSDHPQVVNLVMASMRQAFEVLYTLGARTFIAMNVTPLGCTPCALSTTTTLEKDEYNCSRAWNDFVRLHNKNLEELLNALRFEYPMAEWIRFDAYSIFLDGYQNSSKYGILYPFQACCGAGGPYNFNSEAQCGGTGIYINGTSIKAKKCKDPSSHLIWDTLHPVESFSKYIAQGVLYGTHLNPTFNIRTRFHNLELQ